ncbi:efflux RND transporter permease subunit [Taibaiella soli]|uniref:AcrB/AcrD/AcrF family protein n=1 Tax=Taibaiella soli TaxID=1649169 RepID=A0A2W2AYL5_9BACT|nr:efflux RND transporter permease subunit [Taibaiella soli]PZF73094.1 AcrB/AcrD/AcrF family protein [Taibaiella soli]
MKDTFKEFKPSSWAIDHRTAIYIVTVIITLAGLLAYINLPKEQFPEIKIPQIIVQTLYPGTSPENMENLVTKQIEKQVKNLTGIKKVTSNSFQDYSVVIVEFNTDVKIDKAKQDVKDAVDKARPDMPQNLPNEPEVKDIDLSELPILNVNISGNYDLNRLKKYADKVKDNIEGLKEIKRVDMVGAPEREIQINVDMFKLQASGFTFDDIDHAVQQENVSATAGQVSMDNQKRLLSIKNEFKTADQIGNIIVKNQSGKAIYLHDIADVEDSFEEQKSYARLGGNNVITLNIIKAKGENLIDASDKIEKLLEEMEQNDLPRDLKIVVTGDQSEQTRHTLTDLVNTIIIGFILVTVILMFFMGVTNALFVALSVPLSCAIAFFVLPTIGFTLNMIVLFSFLLALGIVVDDAIVVIENTHRIFDNGKVPIDKAAKIATHEVFLPVLSGTATTLMPFVPLAFWPGVIGSFLFYLPITLIITLLASLIVAYIINPVFAVSFMKPHEHTDKFKKARFTKRDRALAVVFGGLALLFYLSKSWGVGNFIIFIYLFILLEKYVFAKWIFTFQNKVWPAFQNWYTKWLKVALDNPGKVVGGTVILFILSIVTFVVRKPNIVFFPDAQPNFTYVYLNLPVGTDQAYTNEVLRKMEGRVNHALGIDPKTGKGNDVVKSVISNVTINAVDQNSGEIGDFPNKGKITVAYVEFAKRHGVSTWKLMEDIRNSVRDIPGAEVTVDKESSGPPLAKPIVIEITGDNLDSLVSTSEKLKRYLQVKQIGGVEELRSDFQAKNPEIVFDLNRERMNNESISTYTVVNNLRTAIFGKEVSRFRDQNDDYPITLRLKKDQRENIDAVRNMPIIFRDMGMGGVIRQVPLSAFADVHYSSTYGGIKRKNETRIITLSSNVITGFNPNEVVQNIQTELGNFHKPSGISIRMGGQQEDQAETTNFLGRAMMIAMALIFMILILQFNSLSKTLIILSEVLFSLIGVILGISIFKTNFSIAISGIGIVALAGVVVRNGILLVEFMDLMLAEGMSPHDALVEAGRTRMTPVLLTATAAILGLIPLAVGMNIDFASFFSHLNPHIFFGGDSADFWAPLAWTMIYGLSFATFLTLILVPVLCLLSFRFKAWVKRIKDSAAKSLE